MRQTSKLPGATQVPANCKKTMSVDFCGISAHIPYPAQMRELSEIRKPTTCTQSAAKDLLTMLDNQRRIIEISDIEARIVRLEQVQGK